MGGWLKEANVQPSTLWFNLAMNYFRLVDKGFSDSHFFIILKLLGIFYCTFPSLFCLPSSPEPQEDFCKTNKTIAAFGVTLTYIFKTVQIM